MYKNLILIGMPGCGKTTLGKMLAEYLSVKFYDIDECIEMREKKSIKEIFKNGENYFRKIESIVLKDICENKFGVIATGGGVIKTEKNLEVMKNTGIVFFIDRPLENIISDVDIEKRPLLKEGKHKMYGLYKERYSLYLESCDYRIDNSLNIESALEKILDVLKSVNS